ncbi:MAG: PilZ domain-containing protein [Deltaproteobacteria bacterium]|nr:PilZ domain-containing protein [Deltaproteobacteria bacterium]
MAFAALRGGFKKVGRVKDISIGGVAFTYLSDVDEVNADPHHSQVDIFLSENGFHLSNVPCKIVYDTPVSSNDEVFVVNMIRCGLHFGELAESQLDQLNFFIKHHTEGVLKP